MSILSHFGRTPDVVQRRAMVSRVKPRDDLAKLKQLSIAILGISLALMSLIVIVAFKTGTTFWLHRF